ncbi:putative transcription factor interactor and regulator CCHC(Zn) family [Helianthus anomalus]
MPPRRDQAQDAALAALITQQFAAVLPNLITQINQANNNNNNVQCTFKSFNSAKSLIFTGSEGATGILQWFESLESTFRHVQSPNERKVELALSVFQKRALTWWNDIMRDRGADVAMAQTWEELRALMMKEFCPRHELRALEREFDNLKQDSVQDIVSGSNPTTVRQAIELSATLTESQIRKGKLFQKGDPKPSNKTAQEKQKDKQTESSKNSKKRKASQNFAVVAQNDQVAPYQLAQPRARKNYIGTAPLCNKCNRHHVNQTPCHKCTHCGGLGHLVNTCRHVIQNQNAANPVVVQAQFPPGSCYNFGDLTHYRNNFPRLVNANPARGRVFNINEANANNNAAVNN